MANRTRQEARHARLRESTGPAGAISGIQSAPSHQTATLAGNMAPALLQSCYQIWRQNSKQ
jgi:hypothetical protein